MPPEVGDTWQIDAIDQSGTFGSITIERGKVVRLRQATTPKPSLPGPAVASLCT